MMKVLSIISQKGGVGKTTLAMHLGVAAVQARMPTLVFDIDEQGSAYKWFKDRQAGNGGDFVEPAVKPIQSVELHEAIHERPHGAELVIIDTPPATNPGTLNAAEIADLVLLPCTPTEIAIKVIGNTIRMCRSVDKEPLVVFTMIPSRGSITREFAEKVRHSNIRVCPFGTGHRVAYHYGAIGGGLTALEYDSEGKGAQETKLLFNHLITKELGLSPRGARHAVSKAS